MAIVCAVASSYLGTQGATIKKQAFILIPTYHYIAMQAITLLLILLPCLNVACMHQTIGSWGMRPVAVQHPVQCIFSFNIE